MTWRERIQEARKRGTTTYDERGLWGDLSTCPAAEIAEKMGVEVSVQIRNFGTGWGELWSIGSKGFRHFLRCEWDKAEASLDEMEDRALQLKREAK